MSIVPPPDGEHGGYRDTTRLDFPHGVRTGYVYGCRCVDCRAAQRNGLRIYQQKRRKSEGRAPKRLDGRPTAAEGAADWLEGQDYDGSEDFGRGFMHAVRLLRGE